MSVFDDVTISWGGKDYTFRPHMRLVRKIDAEVNLSKMAVGFMRGEIVVSHLAYALEMCLREAGAKNVSPDDIYQAVAYNDEDALDIAIDIVNALSPKPKEKKQDVTDKKP